jgi:ABC-2 type transport system ATP-binding protein
MAVVDHGRVIAEGTSHELKSSIGGNALRFQLADPAQRAEAQALVQALLGDGILPNTDPTAISVKVSDASAASEVLRALAAAKIQLTDFSLGTPSLDDVFFALTGRPPEAESAAATGSVVS